KGDGNHVAPELLLAETSSEDDGGCQGCQPCEEPCRRQHPGISRQEGDQSVRRCGRCHVVWMITLLARDTYEWCGGNPSRPGCDPVSASRRCRVFPRRGDRRERSPRGA